MRMSVFTVSMRKVRTIEVDHPAFEEDLEWDTRDDAGRPLGNGLYYVSIEMRGKVGDPERHLNKVMILR